MTRPRRGAVGALALALVLVLTAACAEGGGVERADVPRTSVPSTTTTTATASLPTSATTAPTTTAPPEPAGEPIAATEPAGLARQLRRALTTIADPASRPGDVAAAGHLQQVATAAMVANPAWDLAVSDALPEPLRAPVAADVAAGRELAALVRTPQSTLPAWRIRTPPDPAVLRGHYDEAAATTGVPWPYLAAIHLVETRMSRIDGLSSAGAQGPMQFLPSTWAIYGEGGDIEDDRDAILAAGRFLAAQGAPTDLAGALYRYNPTPRYVRAVTAYAERIRADERAFLGYHGWEVRYRTTLGDVWLRPGYEEPAPRPVTPADLSPG